MSWLKGFWKDLWYNPWQAKYMWPLIVINITGSLYGYYWYRNQLQENPWYLWVLIADSPLSTTLFALALVLVLINRGISILTIIGTATTIKYGLWALVILTHYWLVSGDVRLVEIGLWLGHLGMISEGLIFMRRAQIGFIAAGGALAWMFFNDGADYIYHLHPYLYLPEQEQLAMLSAVFITVLVFIYILINKRRLQQL